MLIILDEKWTKIKSNILKSFMLQGFSTDDGLELARRLEQQRQKKKEENCDPPVNYDPILQVTVSRMITLLKLCFNSLFILSPLNVA